MADLQYFICVEEDEIPLEGSVTIGRHLDNDVVVAGEDVLDFHLRLEATDRGPRVFPLGEATVIVNEQDQAKPIGLAVGDVLQVGQTAVTFRAQSRMPVEAYEWWLHADGDDAQYKVTGTLHVGRAEDNEIPLLDDHISRHHAWFRLSDGVVWLKDLGSANGTFVNGERISGGCRLFHGDQVAFDVIGFQLIGSGADLTAVWRVSDTDEQPAKLSEPLKIEAGVTTDTTEIAVIDDTDLPDIPESSETGAFLLGVSEPVSGMTFRTRIGRTLIGRSDDCDVVIADSSVSARHAELVTRPESCTVTNLLATNGTRVNGQAVQSAELKDGDLLRVGRVHLVYKDVPIAVDDRPRIGRAQWLLLGGSLLLALLLAALLL